jgi:P27 family predicted phage terminase small subunit
MKRGRKPVPTVLKRLHGYPGHHKRTGVELDGMGSISAPVWFNAEQRAQWDHALENAPPGLLTATDRECLVTFCLAAALRAQAMREVERSGMLLKTKNGALIQNPYVGIVNRQALIMLRAGAELGFSPASRASLGASVASEQEDGMSDLDAYLSAKPDKLS